MASRKKDFQTQRTRDKIRDSIKTKEVTKKLQDHALSEHENGKPKVKMTTSQIKAAEILLSRTMPTLTMADINYPEDEMSLEDMKVLLTEALGDQAPLVLKALGIPVEKLH